MQNYYNPGVFELPPVTAGEAFRLYFTRYVDFGTRSRRSEYWASVILVSIIAGALGLVFQKAPIVGSLWSLATVVPNVAVTVRRLHDSGKSGWNYLWNLLPGIGQIILFVFLCKDSDPTENRWGKSPKYAI